MMKRWVMLVGLVVQLMACAHVSHEASSAPQSPHVRHLHMPKLPFFSHFRSRPKPKQPSQLGLHQLDDFDRVIIIGAFNVRLHTDAIRPALLIHGDPRDTAKVKWKVWHHTLRIVLNKKYPIHAPVEVDISTRYLRGLQYKGKGSISGYRLHAKQLDISITNKGATSLEGELNLHNVVLDGSGTVYLKGGQSSDLNVTIKNKVRVQIMGVARMQTLHMTGCSWLTLYWLKTPSLELSLRDQARVQIAGTADLLSADLRGSSRFNGRYLRAQEAFVKTHGTSRADIAVLHTQHTLASDASNIYYHDLPVFRTDFMAFDGAVLDMGAWEKF